MKVQLSLISLAVATLVASALAEDQTQLAQLSTKGGEQMMRPAPDRSAPLSPEAAEVERLSRAGVNEKVILNHVGASPGYVLTAEDVLSLHQRGVSLTVITAMIHHPAGTPNAAQPPNATPQPMMATVATTTGPNPPIIYPTPAREAVPLTDPMVVSYSGVYGGPTVLIVSSPYSYAAGSPYSYFRPSYSGLPYSYSAGIRSYGYGSSSYNCSSRNYGCSVSRCRY